MSLTCMEVLLIISESFPAVSHSISRKTVTLRLDVCIEGLRIELVSIPIQQENCNGYEYEFVCLDAH